LADQNPLVSDGKNPNRTGFDFQNQNQILCFEELDPESDSQFHLCLESVLIYFGALDILYVRTICNTAPNTGLPGKYRENTQHPSHPHIPQKHEVGVQVAVTVSCCSRVLRIKELTASAERFPMGDKGAK
jgi:hypothetical protein